MLDYNKLKFNRIFSKWHTGDELSRRIIRLTDNSCRYKSEDEFCCIICLDILAGNDRKKQETLLKYRNQSLSCGHFVKKPSTFRLGIDLETDNPSKTNYPSAGAHMGSCCLLARLTNESVSYEFCSIIRLSTEFILETDYPSRRIILL